MTQERLYHVMLLHVYKDRTDKLILGDVANEFVAGSEHRLHLFWELLNNVLVCFRLLFIMFVSKCQVMLWFLQFHDHDQFAV